MAAARARSAASNIIERRASAERRSSTVFQVARHDFRDRVREVRALAEERFDDGDLASAACNDQVAMMRGDAVAADEQQMNETLDDSPRRDVDESTVAPHGRVQRGQRMFLVVGVAREVLRE